MGGEAVSKSSLPPGFSMLTLRLTLSTDTGLSLSDSIQWDIDEAPGPGVEERIEEMQTKLRIAVAALKDGSRLPETLAKEVFTPVTVQCPHCNLILLHQPQSVIKHLASAICPQCCKPGLEPLPTNETVKPNSGPDNNLDTLPPAA